MTIPERIRKQLLMITMIGGAVRLLLLLLPKSFLVTYRLPDDAMYYFTIARNLASGKGISFDGVDPTNGFHPLWLFVITPIYWLTSGLWDSVYVILVLQSLLDTALIFACGYAAYKALDFDEPQRRFAALAAAMLYAFNPISVIRGINGLETTLAALLLTIWLIEYLKLWRSEKNSYLTLAIVSALVFLARTDLVFLLVPALIVLLIRDIKQGRSLSRYLIPSVAGLAIVSPWLIWSYATFGSIVQTSGEAVAIFAQKKFEIEFVNGGRAGYAVSELIRSWLKPFFYSSYAIGAIALLLLLMKRVRRESLLPFLPLLLGVLGLYTYHIVSRGFIRDWYVIHFIPVFVVLTAIAFAHLTQSRRLFLWMTLTLLFCGWIWEFTHPRMESQAVLATNSRSPKPYMKGGFNSGYFGYLGDGRVVNLDGVVNNGVLHYLRIGDMRRYIDSMHIDEIKDFRGTLGGYRNLFGSNLTEGFTLIDTVDAGGGEILETWSRDALLRP
jgi:hypothetical protein